MARFRTIILLPAVDSALRDLILEKLSLVNSINKLTGSLNRLIVSILIKLIFFKHIRGLNPIFN